MTDVDRPWRIVLDVFGPIESELPWYANNALIFARLDPAGKWQGLKMMHQARVPLVIQDCDQLGRVAGPWLSSRCQRSYRQDVGTQTHENGE
jgi:hypothetical protein